MTSYSGDYYKQARQTSEIAETDVNFASFMNTETISNILRTNNVILSIIFVIFEKLE